MAVREPRVVRFGNFELDQRTCELRKHGLRIKLQQKPLHALNILLGRQGEVVSREELQRSLWPDGVFVDFDHGLNTAIKKLRDALGDTAAAPRYIATVGRQGYRFAADVQEIAIGHADPDSTTVPIGAREPQSERNNRRRIALSLIAASLLLVLGTALLLYRRALNIRTHPIRSIAVLPLKNLSSDPEQEYFSEGLTDELITRLASLEGLRVISHTSVAQYRDSRKSLPAIAKELRVDALVEGSVLRSGERVRITAQLVDSNDRHLWAESYERDQRDVLSLQNELTREIATNISLSLNPDEREQLASSRPIDPEAYADYLQGRFYWSKRTAGDLKTAIRYFEQAISRDPNYANAHAGLADSYMLLSGYSAAPRNESISEARAEALRALQIDKRLAEAHVSLAAIAQNYDWDWQFAETEYQRAIRLDPGQANAHHWHAECLAFQGHFDEALHEIERARELDPMSLIIAADKGVILYFARQYRPAIEQFRSVLQKEPNFPRARVVIGAYEQQGLFKDALSDLENWERLDPATSMPWVWAHRTYIYAHSGEQARAQRALEQLQSLNSKRQIDAGPFVLAYIGLGQKDTALAWLQKAYLEHSPAIAGLKVDPVYDPLRSDPRFKELMRRVGLAQ